MRGQRRYWKNEVQAAETAGLNAKLAWLNKWKQRPNAIQWVIIAAGLAFLLFVGGGIVGMFYTGRFL